MVQGPATPIATASQRARYRIGFLVPLLEGIGSVVATAAPIVSAVSEAATVVSAASRLFGGSGIQLGTKQPGMTPAGLYLPNLTPSRGLPSGIHILSAGGQLEPPAGQRRFDLGYPTGALPPTNVPYTGFGSGEGRGLRGATTMSIMPYGDGGAMPIVKSVLKWLRSLAFRFGADVAQGAWDQIQQLVGQGHSETTAMEIIRDDYRSGGQRAPTGKRRRMNPYNRRALRRAIRRVRSARRG